MTSTRFFQPEAQAEEDLRFMVMLLDLQDAAPPIRRLRDWALAVAEPRAGEVVLDVGSGTGTMTRALAELVGPDGRAVGVEPNDRLRQIAESRAVDATAVTFLDGRAATLPTADGSVDLLWCERVLQHVADPQAAIEEFARVLRPGGRAVVLDSDHASRVMSGFDPVVEAKLLSAFMAGIPNPRAARRIPEQAARAGLTVDPDIGSSALIFAPPVLLNTPFVTSTAERAVAAGHLSQAEADDAVRAVHDAARAGHAFAAVTVFGFVLRKPVTDGSPAREGQGPGVTVGTTISSEPSTEGPRGA